MRRALTMCAVLFAAIAVAAAQAPTAGAPASPQAATLIKTYTYDFDADLDADRQPDFWTRTIDAAHPHYVTAELDFTVAQAGKGSLRIKGDGAPAEFMGPPITIEGSAAYDLAGYIKTDSLPTTGLRQARAYVEARLYDKEGQALASVRCFPEVSGTSGWQRVWATDVSARHPGTATLRVVAVLDGLSLSGSAWFDSIEVRKRPEASLATNRAGNCFLFSDKKTVSFEARGLPPGHYSLALTVRNRLQDVKHKVSLAAAAGQDGTVSITYSLPALDRGAYTVEVELSTDGSALLVQSVRMGILPDRVLGETGRNFGISFSTPPRLLSSEYELTDISGAGWVKIPLVEAAADTSHYLRMVSELRRKGMNPVGILTIRAPVQGQPGDAAPSQRPDLSACLSKGPDAWLPLFTDTINTFAGGVQWWQIGDESETAIAASPHAAQAVGEIGKFTNAVSYQAKLGIPAGTTSKAELPPVELQFVSIEASRLKGQLAASPPAGAAAGLPAAKELHSDEIWAWIDPSTWPTTDTNSAASAAVSDIATTFAAGAGVVYLRDPWTNRGILDGEGNVTPFALVLVNLVNELGNYSYNGSIAFPNGTPNVVFAAADNTKVLLWPAGDPKEERIFLGEAVEIVDLFGGRSAAPLEGGENVILVKDGPIILDRVDPAVVDTRKTFAIEPEIIDSVYEVQPVYVTFTNEFPAPIVGELSLTFPAGWEAQPNVFFVRLKPGESFRGRANLVVPYNAVAGQQEIDAALYLGDVGAQKITLVQRKQLSSRTFKMEMESRRSGPGVLVYQKVTNISDRGADVSGFLEGEGLERVERLPRRVEPGASATFSYALSDAAFWEGRMLRASIRETKTNRFLNQEFTVSTATGP